MNRLAVFLVACFVTCPILADQLYSVQIASVHAQSRVESDAHLVQVIVPAGQTIASQCSNNRLYIDINDKELFSSALANYVAAKAVSITYFSNAIPKTAVGHVAGITCKVVSIF